MKLIRLLFFLFISSNALAQTGTISGKVVEAGTGEPIPGATVLLDDSAKHAVKSDIEGNYTISNIEPGSHIVSCNYFSYNDKRITEIPVEAGKTTTVNVMLESETKTLTQVEVVSFKITNTENAVIADMKKSDNVVSGVSGNQIQKSQDPDAAAVVKRIPGVTIIENRFILVRGLNDRYNNVWLNDAGAPSSETDKKAFSFDVIPAGLIDRILIYKTPSPDLPGDFAGGMVKVYTKSIPEKTNISFEIKGCDRPGSTFQSFDYTNRSKTDYLGFDNSLRNLPSGLNPYVSKNDANNSAESKSFANNWSLNKETAMPDQRINFYYNQRINLKKATMGNVFGINYSDVRTVYSIHRQDWDSTAQTLDYTDRQSTRTVRSCVIENFAFMRAGTKIEFKNLYNQAGTEQTVLRTGNLLNAPNEKSYLFSYEAKTTYSSQLTGTHKTKNEKLIYNWTAGYSYIFRNDPDLRRIKYTKAQDAPDSMYKAPVAQVVDPVNGGGRFFSTLKEHVYSFNQSLKYTFTIKNYSFDASAGSYIEQKNRAFQARTLGYTIAPSFQAFNLTREPIDQIFSDQNVGVPGGFKIDEITNPSDKYNAQNKLYAAYGMLNLPLGKKIKIIGGIRYEYNIQALQSHVNLDSISPQVITKFLLPSVNAAYNINDKQLIRFAFGKTLNRPEFREWSPFYFYDFNFNAGTYGSLFPTVLSPNGSILKVAQINNYDLRWEFYPKYGEFIQIGAFYKSFIDPIQQVILYTGSGNEYTFLNGTSAYVEGVELDARKNLSFFDTLFHCRIFSSFSLVGNVSFMKSQLNIPKSINQANNSPLQGQSPYVINGGLYYQNDSIGLQGSILYNVYGARIYLLGTINYPNIGELPRNTLDITISKKIKKHISITAAVQDVLNNPVLLVQDTNKDGKFTRNGDDKMIVKYKRGPYYSLGIKIIF